MPTVYKRCGKSLNVNKISEGRHAAVRLVYNEVHIALSSYASSLGIQTEFFQVTYTAAYMSFSNKKGYRK